MNYIKALRTLFCYVILGLFLALPAAPLLPFIGVSEWVFNGWLAIDITICTWAHNTKNRSISGWAGQHKNNHKRYFYIACVIDFIFKLLTKEKNHCYNAYLGELKEGFVK